MALPLNMNMKMNLLTAPSDIQRQTPPAPPAAESPVVDTPVNILIVDDEPRNLTVLESLLENPGYRIVRAESANLALLALVVDEFALLILDIQMPGMSGFELALMIKERKKTASVPIIFLTAYYNEDQHVLEGYGSGAVDYLHKPVNPVILRSKVAVFAELYRNRRECGLANRALLAEVVQRRHAEEQLRALTHRLVQLQEIERGRVALELHDNLTQPFCAVILRWQALAEKLPARGTAERAELTKLSELLARNVDALQRIGRNLLPSVLEHLGLVPVLRSESAEFAERTGVPVKATCGPLTARPTAEVELAFYRILQEALKNVERHARARHVTVDLAEQGTMLRLVVQDDGLGFDPDHPPAGQTGERGFGLLSLRERAVSVGGSVSVKSAPGKGTAIEVQIPFGWSAGPEKTQPNLAR